MASKPIIFRPSNGLTKDDLRKHVRIAKRLRSTRDVNLSEWLNEAVKEKMERERG